MSYSDSDKKFVPLMEAARAWRSRGDDFFATEQAREIFKKHLPEALERFVRKNADYGDTALFLGAKGQFADINPKFWKLKRALWDGEELHGESLQEILQDLIGHCLLTLFFLDNDAASERLPFVGPANSTGEAVIVVEGQNLEPGKWRYDYRKFKWVKCDE